MENKIINLIEKMPNEIDAFMIHNGVNRYYFTNFSSTEGTLLITRKKGYLLLDFRYFEMAKKSVENVEVLIYTDLYEKIDEILKKDSAKNIAVETNHTSIQKFKEYKEKLKDFEFTELSVLDDLILEARSVKTEEEVRKMKESQKVVDAAFKHILQYIKEGKTEKEVAREIESYILDNAQSVSFPAIVVSGKNSSLPHGRPGLKKLEKGDFVTMDFGAVLDGYCSDMTRTVCVGKPSDFQKELYNIVLLGQELALNNIKEGLVCKDVDFMVREYFQKFSYVEEFGHGLGHGVGLEIHEDPYLNKICNTILKSNMVVTVEPGLYLSSKMGLRIEDMVVVKQDGILNLTESSKELISI